MVTWHIIRRSLRRLHHLRDSDPVPGELRGWSYDSPPVKPRAYLGLGVSEVAYGASCGWRSLWLRRRGKAQEPTQSMEAGAVLHEAFHRAARDVRLWLARGLPSWLVASRLVSDTHRRLPRGWPPWAYNVYRLLVTAWAGEAAGQGLYYGGDGLGSGPWLSEYMVDGSPLGLSRSLRVDGLAEAGVVVEVKLGRSSWWHKLSLAGYALAMESFFEAPIDYGVVVAVSIPGRQPRVHVDPVYVSADLREEFLRARDDAVEALLSDSEPEDRCGGVKA